MREYDIDLTSSSLIPNSFCPLNLYDYGGGRLFYRVNWLAPGMVAFRSYINHKDGSTAELVLTGRYDDFGITFDPADPTDVELDFTLGGDSGTTEGGANGEDSKPKTANKHQIEEDGGGATQGTQANE